MMNRLRAITTVSVILFLAAACIQQPPPASPEHLTRATAVGARHLLRADAAPGDWLLHGRSYAEDRHSPLDEITAANVHELGLAWSYDLGTDRGIEATPIVASAEVHDQFEAIVLDGLRAEQGMPSFEGRLSRDQARDIRAYSRARLRLHKPRSTRTDGDAASRSTGSLLFSSSRRTGDMKIRDRKCKVI